MIFFKEQYFIIDNWQTNNPKKLYVIQLGFFTELSKTMETYFPEMSMNIIKTTNFQHLLFTVYYVKSFKQLWMVSFINISLLQRKTYIGAHIHQVAELVLSDCKSREPNIYSLFIKPPKKVEVPKSKWYRRLAKI